MISSYVRILNYKEADYKGISLVTTQHPYRKLLVNKP